jgi:hypothetical protein
MEGKIKHRQSKSIKLKMAKCKLRGCVKGVLKQK